MSLIKHHALFYTNFITRKWFPSSSQSGTRSSRSWLVSHISESAETDAQPGRLLWPRAGIWMPRHGRQHGPSSRSKCATSPQRLSALTVWVERRNYRDRQKDYWIDREDYGPTQSSYRPYCRTVPVIQQESKTEAGREVWIHLQLVGC